MLRSAMYSRNDPIFHIQNTKFVKKDACLAYLPDFCKVNVNKLFSLGEQFCNAELIYLKISYHFKDFKKVYLVFLQSFSTSVLEAKVCEPQFIILSEISTCLLHIILAETFVFDSKLVNTKATYSTDI